MRSVLRDKDNVLKSFSQFKKDATPIIGKYNVQYLQTEHTTAVRSARNTANFRKFLRTANIYPNLEYLASRAANPRQAHKAFYGIILPIWHDFWKKYTPPIDWNCLCGITNTDEEPTEELPVTNVDVAPGLDNNPAFTKELFAKSHPYYKRPKRKEYNQILESTKRVLRKSVQIYNREWAKTNIDQVKGLVINSNNIEGGKLTLRRKDIKTLTGKAHKHLYHKNSIVTKLPDIFDELEYVGKAAELEKHAASEWHYYKLMVNEEPSYLCVMKVDNEFRPHAITDIDITKYLK